MNDPFTEKYDTAVLADGTVVDGEILVRFANGQMVSIEWSTEEEDDQEVEYCVPAANVVLLRRVL